MNAKSVSRFAALSGLAFLTGCGELPVTTPPATAANINVSSMSLAAQRFKQFCIDSIGGPRDGVDLASAFYKTPPMAVLGTLKVSDVSESEDIAVQYDTARRGCRLTSSQGRAPNGDAEVAALATAFAARVGGTVRGGGMLVYSVKSPTVTAEFQFADGPSGLYFQVEH